MTVFQNELRQGRIPLLIWTVSLSLLIVLCILIYPDMSAEMAGISALFANLGRFSAAFGMDRINFAEFTGFFAVECGNILGLGGAFFAALTAVNALAKEEREHTAEFLFTHPVSRQKVAAQKLLAVFAQILFLNAGVLAFTCAGIAFIGETASPSKMMLLFCAYFLMQLETAAITFGLSAFLRRDGAGIGLVLACGFYFLNMAANLSDRIKWLKYLTPFSYTEGADILTGGALRTNYLAAGALLGIAGVAAAFWKYSRKDLYF